jgi:hypothetical protein
LNPHFRPSGEDTDCGGEADFPRGLGFLVGHKIQSGASRKAKKFGYYGLLTVTMGYQAGNFDRRDAEERRGKIMEGKFI